MEMRSLILAGALLLAIRTPLPAQLAPASLEGQVTSSRGAALAGAKVTATDSGGKVFSAMPDADGIYRIAAIPAGVYTFRVRCTGYTEAVKSNVRISAGSSLQLNFVLQRNPGIKMPANATLGKVGFYENSDLRSGQLKDPSAGGGYSDQAAIHRRTMVKQYLAPVYSPASGPSRGSAATTNDEDAGSAWLAKGDFPRAAQAFQNALARDPRSARLETGLGIAQYSQGQYDQAVESFSKAVRLSPGDPHPYLLLSEADRASNHSNSEARQILKQFVEIYPKSAQAHYAYGMDLLKDSNAITQAQARSEIEKATALNPSFAQAHFQLGVIYDQEKMTPQAIREYEWTVRLNPASASAHYRLAQDYFRSGAAVKGNAELQVYEKLRHSGSGKSVSK